MVQTWVGTTTDHPSEAQRKLLRAGPLRPLQGPERSHLNMRNVFWSFHTQRWRVGSCQSVSEKVCGHQWGGVWGRPLPFRTDRRDKGTKGEEEGKAQPTQKAMEREMQNNEHKDGPGSLVSNGRWNAGPADFCLAPWGTAAMVGAPRWGRHWGRSCSSRVCRCAAPRLAVVSWLLKRLPILLFLSCCPPWLLTDVYSSWWPYNAPPHGTAPAPQLSTCTLPTTRERAQPCY